MSVKLLYFGMADDILSPLILFNEVDVIYAIDCFDMSFSPDQTWEGQKEQILHYLRGETDVYRSEDGTEVRLDEPCKILSSTDVHKCAKETGSWDRCIQFYHDRSVEHSFEKPRCKCAGRWEVNFTYKEKNRKLVYFHDFWGEEPWPREIEGISIMLTWGAEFEPINWVNIRNGLETRCLPTAWFSKTRRGIITTTVEDILQKIDRKRTDRGLKQKSLFVPYPDNVFTQQVIRELVECKSFISLVTFLFNQNYYCTGVLEMDIQQQAYFCDAYQECCEIQYERLKRLITFLKNRESKTIIVDVEKIPFSVSKANESVSDEDMKEVLKVISKEKLAQYTIVY